MMFRRAQPDAVAQPADRDQQDDAGDRHENIVEAGQQAEGFFIHHRAGPQPGDMIAQRLRALRGDNPRRYSIL